MPGPEFAATLGVPAEPGTLLGPDSMGELLVAVGPTDDGRTRVAYASKQDIEAALQHLAEHGPRSLTEANYYRLGIRGV